MIKITTITNVNNYIPLASMSDDWRPICVFNGDWFAKQYLSFDLVVHQNVFYAIKRNLFDNDSTVSGTINSSSTELVRLYIVWTHASLWV